MFSWLKKRDPAPAESSTIPLFFKDTQTAFQYSCEYLLTDLTDGAILPALVLDAAATLGNGSAVRYNLDGIQVAMLRVSSKDGGFMVIAESLSASGPVLRPGDLVAWQAGASVPELASQFPDKRSTWAGLILAKLKPEYLIERGWAIQEPFKRQSSNSVSTQSSANIDFAMETDRLFDDSSIPELDGPKAVILMGGVATGKTHTRIRDYSRGFVLIDAAEMFHHLSRGDEMLDFPSAFLQPLELIGSLVAQRALKEKRNIVTEIIGADRDATIGLIESLKAIGYSVDVVGITCEFEESVRRNETRGDSISAYYAEPFQMKWIGDACRFANARVAP